LSWFGSLRLLSGLAGWSFEDVRDNGGQVVHSLFNLKINNFVIKKELTKIDVNYSQDAIFSIQEDYIIK